MKHRLNFLLSRVSPETLAIIGIVIGYFVVGAYFDPFSDSVADWLDAKGW